MTRFRTFSISLGLWRLGALGAVGLAWAPVELPAHSLTITQVLVSFDEPGEVSVTVDIDLTSRLASTEAYEALSAAGAEAQERVVVRLLPGILDDLRLFVGPERLTLELKAFELPKPARTNFQDPGSDKFTTLHLVARLPAESAPLLLDVPPGARVDFPVAFIVRIPSAHLSETSWIEEGGTGSDPFYWADVAGRTRRTPPKSSIEDPPWPRQLATFLALGFRHIVPEGTDHILFVLGLFFLGVTWRKLLAQTTAFTVAHATTLFLSSYGIFSLPSRWVEPAIALSIAFIALENVWSGRLGAGRLAVVFGFGLVHGLGFASSLNAVPFPKHRFLIALLGFNFGVDGGQLFVIGLAFLAVGWFRNRPWFRGRIAVPCSLAIAAVGLLWAAQRIAYYAAH